jgi:(R,R)-butanediol dehydrogenase / meso-butanediol dehydrogenase / diacetyl reductase
VRAVVANEQHRFDVREVPDPDVRAGNIIVRVAACGICGSDLHMMEAKIVPAGAIMGHEASGIVEAVGPGVTGLAPGDHVAIHPFDPCLRCEQCRTGATQRCVNNALTTIGLGFRPGAYAELIELSAPMGVKVSRDADLAEVSLAEPLAVALHGFRRSDFSEGMNVGVIGCGPIGLSAVICAKALGASHVWASDTNPFRTDLAKRVGADEAGSHAKDADITFDCAGAQGTVDLAVGSTHQGGQAVVLAVNIKGDNVFPFTWVTREVEIVPCLGYSVDEYRECAEWISSGRVDVRPMITRRVSLDETDEAFFGLLAGAREGKVLVTP